MKKILLISALLASFIASASNLVEPGKTWWYQTYLGLSHMEEWNGVWPKVIVGLRIEDSLPEEPEWYPCVALDSLSRPVLDTPLAWLREEGSKVWVRPNLTLSENYDGNSSNELYVLAFFLGYWNGNELPGVKYIQGGYIDPVWNVKGEKEFLLYDFDGEEVCEWPWSGVFIDFSNYDGYDMWAYDRPEGGMGLWKVSRQDIIYGDGLKRSVKLFTMAYNIQGEGELFVLDGIGAVETSTPSYGIPSYVPDMNAWQGFFIAPLSLGLPAIASLFNYPDIPTLIYVTDSSGEVIYYDKDYYYETAGLSESLADGSGAHPSTIYDLHGRAVTQTLPGSIYIRDGKKFVAR